jgi:helicase MOV-10
MVFNVRFEFPRISLRRSHQALSLLATLPKSLRFPTLPPASLFKSPLSLPTDIHSRTLRDLNHEQKVAIVNILERKHGIAPYVIFGPPGTGKTKCVVESIRQIYTQSTKVGRKVHVLAMVSQYTYFIVFTNLIIYLFYF